MAAKTEEAPTEASKLTAARNRNLDLAIQQKNDDLAAALRGNLARYQRQADSTGGAKP